MLKRGHVMHRAKRLSVWIVSGLLYAAAAFAPAQATEPAQDEDLSGVITIRGNQAEVQALHSVFDRPGELPAPHTALR